MAERWAQRVGTLLAVPAVALMVGVPAWWFVQAASTDPPQAGVPDQQPPPDVDAPDAALERISELPGRFEGIPVINYHDISDGDSPYAFTPARFAEHMAVLDAAGVETVGLRDVQHHLDGTAELPERPVLITFDDGTTSIYESADPILESHGFSAVSFLVTSTTSEADRSYHLNRVTIDEMVRSGRWEFGAHTHDLHHLVETDGEDGPALLRRKRAEDGSSESLADWRARVESDLDRNIELIREYTGRRPTAFAYPFSAVSSDDPAIAVEAPALVNKRFPLQFTAGVGNVRAIYGDEQDDAVPLPRLSVQDDLSAEGLVEALIRMTPPKLASDLTTATFEASSTGRCTVAGAVVSIDANEYTACRTTGHRRLAEDVRLEARVVGNDRRSTAIIGVEGPNGNVEVAVGESRAQLRTRLDGDWTIIDEAPVRAGADGSVEVALAVVGGRVSAVVGGLELDGSCSDCGRYSGVVLAVATQERGVSFVEPTLVQRGLPER